MRPDDPRPSRRPHLQVVRVLLALAVAPAALHGADEPPAKGPLLPGRIFLHAQRQNNEVHGVLALDPNDRNCAQILPGERYGDRARVSPDGRSIALVRAERMEKEKRLSFAVWVVDADGEKEPVRVFDQKGTVCWSDRDHVLVSTTSHDGPEAGVWRVKADGSGKVKLPLSEREIVTEASPDGRSLLSYSRPPWMPEPPASTEPELRPVFLVPSDGKGGREIMPAPTLGARALNEPPSVFYVDFHFSPDGQRVLYTRVESFYLSERRWREHHYLWVVDADGKNRRLMFSKPEGVRFGTSAWSPDGETVASIVYVPQEPDSEVFPSQLWVIAADGENQRAIPLPRILGLRILDWR